MGPARPPPVTLALLVANLAAYGAQELTGHLLTVPFALWPLDPGRYVAAPPFHLWQLLTYGFLHDGPAHLFFNMFALYMFGTDIERLLGSRRFLAYYLFCVAGAAVRNSSSWVSSIVHRRPRSAPRAACSGCCSPSGVHFRNAVSYC